MSNEVDDEKNLVIKLINGDEDAFCRLYASYKNRLIYYAMRFLKSRECAEDIFQDTFTIIWKGRRFINPDASFSSYVFTIVRNRILNQIRDLDNHNKLKEYILSQAVDFTDNTRNDILSKDLQNILQNAIRKLTERQKEVFFMSRNELKSHNEIADRLGISVNTVQEHISTSLRVLRSYLQKHSITGVNIITFLLVLI